MTIRTSLSVLAISTTLSFGWAALAQQNPATGTPPPSGPTGGSGTQSQPANNTGAAGSTSGGQQVISCLQRGAQGTQGATSGSGTASAGTQSGSAGSAGTAATGAGSTGNTTGGSTGTPGSTGTSTAGAAGSTTATTGSATTGATGSGSSSTGTAGSTGSGSTTNGTPSTGNTTASTPGTTPANSGAAAGGKNLSALSSAEVCFLDKAAASNQFEIQSSQLALQKSTNSTVKKVAQMIINDHQAAGAKLKALAATYGAVPSTQINTQQQQLIQTMRGQSGKNFDLVYLTQQVAAHNEAINLFTSYSQPASAADAAVRQFAAQTLPALKAHQQMVVSAQKTVSGAGSTNTTKPATGTPASSGSK